MAEGSPEIKITPPGISIRDAMKDKVFSRFNRKKPNSPSERIIEQQLEFDTCSLHDIECADPVFDTSDDGFQAEVVRKTQKYLIGKREAEVRVMIDRIVEKKGGEDNALLFVITQQSLSERKVELFTTILLHRGANPSVRDNHHQTPLHHAVRRNMLDVCRRLLENDALPNALDSNKVRPLTLAVKKGNDKIGALLLDNTPNAEARALFVSSGEKPAEFKTRELIRKKMEDTLMALLNCMVDRLGSSQRVKVFYSLLESDSKGRTPDHPLFEKNAKSVLYHIAQTGNKTLIYHESIRLLLRKKWKEDMRFRFMLSATFYIFTLFALTYTAVVAVGVKGDPTVYNTPLQISRAVFECMACLYLLITLLMELNQFKRHQLQYWKDLFNILDITSTTLLLIVIPLRFTHMQAQWHVYSIGYILWTFRIFKYSAVFRQTGAYAHILWRVLSYDIIQFMMFFLIILLAFSGSFLLALRGDNSLKVYEETSTFWLILFSGFRTLLDTEPLVEDYIQLPPLSVILVVVFMFLCIVVMLNLLIAQLSDTYQNIQSDAMRGLELNRAWIVTRMEINSLFMWKRRATKYQECEEFQDFQHELATWDSPPVDTIHTKLQRVEEILDSTHVNQTLLLQRLAWQEKALLEIQNRLFIMTNQDVLPDSTNTH